jgi:hypothetical protein
MIEDFGPVISWPAKAGCKKARHAIAELDQVGNAEGCPLIQLSSFQLHFTLADDGQLALAQPEAMSEETSEQIFAFAYSVLEAALMQVYGEEGATLEVLTPTQQARIQAAIEQERERVHVEPQAGEALETELGQDIKKQTGMPNVVINRIVRQKAHKVLKDFKGGGKPH